MGLSNRGLRFRSLALLAGVWLTVMGLSSYAQQAPAPPDPQKEARLEWFREAKYGLFIHWGLYAIPAGEWKGKRDSRHRRVDHEPRADPGEGVRAARARSSTR